MFKKKSEAFTLNLGSNEIGQSLVETMIASGVMLVILTSFTSMFGYQSHQGALQNVVLAKNEVFAFITSLAENPDAIVISSWDSASNPDLNHFINPFAYSPQFDNYSSFLATSSGQCPPVQSGNPPWYMSYITASNWSTPTRVCSRLITPQVPTNYNCTGSIGLVGSYYYSPSMNQCIFGLTNPLTVPAPAPVTKTPIMLYGLNTLTLTPVTSLSDTYYDSTITDQGKILPTNYGIYFDVTTTLTASSYAPPATWNMVPMGSKIQVNVTVTPTGQGPTAIKQAKALAVSTTLSNAQSQYPAALLNGYQLGTITAATANVTATFPPNTKAFNATPFSSSNGYTPCTPNPNGATFTFDSNYLYVCTPMTSQWAGQVQGGYAWVSYQLH